MKVSLAIVAALIASSAGEGSRLEKCRVVQKTTMTCVEATLEDIPTMQNDKIEWFLISKSNIPTIKRDHMKNYPSLTDLHAEKNNIEKIEDDAFVTLKNLDWVDASFNKLTTISPDIFKNCPKILYFNVSGNPDLVIPENEALLKAPSLQWLLLQQSNIKRVYENTFEGVPGLKVLSLSDNSLTALPPGVFKHLKNLYSLDLSKNKLTTLEAPTLEPLRYISLYLSDNPWLCDCALLPTIQWSKNRRLKDDVRCSRPHGKKWQEVINMKCPQEIGIA